MATTLPDKRKGVKLKKSAVRPAGFYWIRFRQRVSYVNHRSIYFTQIVVAEWRDDGYWYLCGDDLPWSGRYLQRGESIKALGKRLEEPK